MKLVPRPTPIPTPSATVEPPPFAELQAFHYPVTAGVIALLVIFVMLYSRKVVNTQYVQPEKKDTPIYRDYVQFEMAQRLWEQERELFADREAKRLYNLSRQAKDLGSIGTILGLFWVVALASIGFAGGFGQAFWTVVVAGAIVAGILTSIAEAMFRWKYSRLFKQCFFSDPAPVYEPPRWEPPPRQPDPPPRPEPQKEDVEIRVTSMKQACAILGLHPGRITLAEARKAYHAKIREYHPDRVACLGKELQDLATRKSKEINLATEFIEQHCS
jgi:hypothetical protein